MAGDAEFSIFICYRRSDSRADAGRLYDALARRFGRQQLFMDVDNLRPGEDWAAAVERAVGESDVVLVLIGQSWLSARGADGSRRLEDASDHVRHEIETALRLDKPTIPVLFEGAAMPAREDLPESLRPLVRRQAIRIAHASFRTDFQALARALRAIDQPRTTRRAAPRSSAGAGPKPADPPLAGTSPVGVLTEAPAEASTAYRGFLFSDLRGYTRYVERRGDAAGAELLDRYRGIVRRAIGRFDGAEVRTEGDSFYVVFPSASAAVMCGLAIVDDAATATRGDPTRPISPGIGVHAGETVERPEGFVGSAVNLAARVCAVADGGEVLVTDTVRSLTRTNLAVRFEPRGKRRLKGITEPIALFRAVGAGSVAASPARQRPSALILTAIGAIVVAGVLGALAVAGGMLGNGGRTGSPEPSPSNGIFGGSPSAAVSPPASASVVPAAGPGLIAYIKHTQSEAGLLMLVNPNTGVETQLVESSETRFVTAAAWSNDGQRIAYAITSLDPEAHELWLARPDGSTAQLIATLSGGPVSSVSGMSFSPDGTHIAFTSGNGLALADAATGEVESLTDGQLFFDRSPAWSPDGSRIAFARGPNDAAAGAGTSQIWTIAPDGSDAAPFGDSPELDADNPSWSPDGTRVAFDAPSLNEGRDIFVTSAEGTSLTRLTNHPSEDYAASWAPDGLRIAFTSTRDRATAIYLMAADGSGQQRLVVLEEAGATLDRPIWGSAAVIGGLSGTPGPTVTPAPAQTIALDSLAGLGKLAFVEWQPDEGGAVVVMNSDGTGRQRLLLPLDPLLDEIFDLAWSGDGSQLAVGVVSGLETGVIWVFNGDGSGGRRFEAAAEPGLSWAPDGRRIAFTQTIPDLASSRTRIAILELDGGTITPLPLDADVTARQPTWSPDGSTIVFAGRIDAVNQQSPIALWSMAADGSAPRELIGSPRVGDTVVRLGDPMWSPDGTRIAFVGSGDVPDFDSNVYVTNAEGTTLAQLTSERGGNLKSAWSPDGMWIVFTSNRDFRRELYVMRADGSGQTRLTDSGDGDSSLPAWAP